MPQLRGRLLWLTAIVVAFAVALALWRPPAADAYVGPYPNLLSRTWYGPALLLLIPVSMYWESLAVTRKSLRIISCVLSVAAFLKAREDTRFYLHPPYRALPGRVSGQYSRPQEAIHSAGVLPRDRGLKPTRAMLAMALEPRWEILGAASMNGTQE